MLKFLLNGNLSIETKYFLEELGYSVKTIAEFGLRNAEDIEIIQFAQKNNYIIITFDLDFGEIYYFANPSKIGIIVLKLGDQTIESVDEALQILLNSKVLAKRSNQNSLIIFDGKKIRIRNKF